MSYQTTLGWSLVTSGIVSLILWLIPGDSVWWGVGLLLVGIAVLYVRRDDLTAVIDHEIEGHEHRLLRAVSALPDERLPRPRGRRKARG